MTTVLTGLVGDHIGESGAPRMHQQEAADQGFALEYHLYDLAGRKQNSQSLARVLEEAHQAGYAGLNITHPYKQAVMPLLDALSPTAARVGAVNTVIFHDQGRIGHNTDSPGFREAYLQKFSAVSRSSVLQLGAGGAGAAVAIALLELGVDELFLFDPDTSRAEALATKCLALNTQTCITALTAIDEKTLDISGLVNASPIGMSATPGLPCPPGLLKSGQWVVDIIYFPLKTAFLQQAQSLGCLTMNGLPMAIHQAAKAFELFTGKPADTSRMMQRFLSS